MPFSFKILQFRVQLSFFITTNRCCQFEFDIKMLLTWKAIFSFYQTNINYIQTITNTKRSWVEPPNYKFQHT